MVRLLKETCLALFFRLGTPYGRDHLVYFPSRSRSQSNLWLSHDLLEYTTEAKATVPYEMREVQSKRRSTRIRPLCDFHIKLTDLDITKKISPISVGPSRGLRTLDPLALKWVITKLIGLLDLMSQCLNH